MKEKLINWLIKVLKADTNKISDGYHTFEELYEHRIELWIRVCADWRKSWKTRTHSDGSRWNGWFVLGLNDKKGEQITYHLPEKYWSRLRKIKTIKIAPEYDGHTSNDVIERLQRL